MTRSWARWAPPGRAASTSSSARAPPAVLAARAAARQARGGGASDAGPEVAARLAAAFSPFALPAGRRLVLDAEQDAHALAERCVAWLDGAA